MSNIFAKFSATVGSWRRADMLYIGVRILASVGSFGSESSGSEQAQNL
jgi:hypothetical protein